MRLGSKSCWRISRWIAKLLLAAAPALLSFANAAEPAAGQSPHEAEAVHITRVELLSVPGNGYTAPPRDVQDAALPEKGWRKVNLPHTVGRELVPDEGSGARTVTDWYRIDLSARASVREPQLLYLPRWKTLGHIAVYGDGALLYQSHGSPIHNGYNHPQLNSTSKPLALRLDS